MIVSFFAHPVAFLLGVLAMLGYGAYTDWPEDSWYPLGVFVAVYLLCWWFLPWWTRPMNLFRYWRAKRRINT